MCQRNSGRTARQLEALPDGSIYVVSGYPMLRHCQYLLFEAGRSPDALRLVILGELRRRAIGFPRSTYFDIDHEIYDYGLATSIVRDEIRHLWQRYSVPKPVLASG